MDLGLEARSCNSVHCNNAKVYRNDTLEKFYFFGESGGKRRDEESVFSAISKPNSRRVKRFDSNESENLPTDVFYLSCV